MSKIEVLCATMHQTNLSKYKEMNIQTDVVFANQADRHEYREERIDGNTVKIVTTPYRGVGTNRNIALLYASAGICMMSDDDMIYAEGYEQGVLEAFEKLPKADVIIFNVESLNKDRPSARINSKIAKVTLTNFMSYGALNIAFRRDSVLRSNIWFTLLFGGGARYCAGEDNLFLRDALRKGLQIYTYPYKIADVKQDGSTWFNGFDAKYFFDHGAWLEAAFPTAKYWMAFLYWIRFRRLSGISCCERLNMMLKGIKAFKEGLSYDEWKEKIAVCEQ
jgi:glycosyltransferase involved in cell wall biosynthesis